MTDLAPTTPPDDARWLQASCAVFLQPGPDGPVPYLPWARLADAVGQWRDEGRFERFFFVRKPPGLRLRFQLDDRGRLEPELASWLTAAEARNDLRGFRFVPYEPEELRFGGPAGMDLAHQAFDADATAALRYESLPATAHLTEDQSAVARAEVSVAVSQHLVQAVVDDRAEAWDVWCRLRKAAGAGAPKPDPTDPDPEPFLDLADAAYDPDGFRRRLLPALAAVVVDAHAANRATADRLRATADAGLLAVGVRRWLVAATTFHWNRWGMPLDPPTLHRTLDQMVRLLAPEAP